MNRRTALTTIAGSASVVLGGGAYVLHRRAGDGGGKLSPVTIETLDAPGSEAGDRTIPVPDTVTVLEFFATWCATCAGYMETLRRVDREIDVAMVSVTNEPIGVSVDREEVVDWWREHDGAWTVGLDDEMTLTTELDATSVPYTVVFDREGRVTYANAGTTSAERLVEVVTAAADP